MRWQAKLRQILPGVVWIGLVVAVAAYGSVVVRNVTEMLAGITRHTPAMVVVERPSR
jgi:uncharacterized membrane protein YqhA